MKVIFLLIVFAFVSCEQNKQVKFNSQKWKYIDGNYDHRDQMIQDLMSNVLKKGMKYDEVEKLLGKPNQQRFENQISYNLYFNFRKEENRVLKIYFANDSTIVKFSRVVWFS